MSSVSAAVRQLSDNNSQGTVMGQSATDLIGFYGATAVAQRTSAVQATISTSAAVAISSGFGFQTATQLNNIMKTIVEIQATLKALGLWKGS